MPEISNQCLSVHTPTKWEKKVTKTMKLLGKKAWSVAACLLILGLVAPQAFAQATKPNILVIMGDDIGISNIGAYSLGMMAGKTPNLDKLAREGMLFTDYYAEASCTAGRANFIM